MKPIAAWEWMLAAVAIAFAMTLVVTQYAPPTVAAARVPTDVGLAGNDVMHAAAVVQDSALGRKVFAGKGICYTCHGLDAKGTPLAPDLTDAEWLNTDGSREGIESIIKSGVAKPVKHPAPMPPMGGAKLSAEEVAAVAAYVYSLSHKQP